MTVGAILDGWRCRPGGGAPADIVSEGSVLTEYDFRSTPIVDLANGPITVPSIEGEALPWVVVNRAAAAVFERNANGVRITPAPSTGAVMTHLSQSAPHLYTTLGNLPNWKQGLDLLVEVFVSAYTAGGAGVSDRCQVGLYKPAGVPLSVTPAQLMGAGFRRSNTVGNLKCVFNCAQSSNGSAEDANLVGVANSFSFKVGSISGGFCSGIGNYAAGQWGTFSNAQTQQTAGAHVFDGVATRLYIAATFASAVSPLMDWTIERVRVSRT